MKPFSFRLAELMNEYGTSQYTLGNAIGVARQSIAQYLDGKTQPNAEKICAIADYYGVSTDYLLGRVEYRTTQMDTQTICEKTGLSENTVNKLLEWSKVEPSTEVVFPTNINVSETKEAVNILDRLVSCEKFGDLVNHLALFYRACMAMPYNKIALTAFAQNWMDVQKVIESGGYETAPASIKSQIDFQNKANVSLTMMTPGMIMMMEEWKVGKTISEIASAIMDEYKSQIVREDKEDAEA